MITVIACAGIPQSTKTWVIPFTIFSFFSESIPSQTSTFTTGRRSPNPKGIIFIYHLCEIEIEAKIRSRGVKRVITIKILNRIKDIYSNIFP